MTETLSPWALPDPLPETPFYFYSQTRLQELYTSFRIHAPRLKLHFAVKANHNRDLLRFFIGRGDGLDLVSGGELERALDVGCDPQKMIFSGVGKSRKEIKRALEVGVGQINIESTQEFEKIQDIAGSTQHRTKLGVRFNPNVDAKTHPYISTGLREHKFGVTDDEAFELFMRKSHLPWQSLSMHIGSQILDLQCLEEAADQAFQLGTRLKAKGVHLPILDIGGGLGVRYNLVDQTPSFAAFGDLVSKIEESWTSLQGSHAEVHCELGRSLVAMAGLLVTRVLGTKAGETKHFAIVDASMTELLRPALYQAEHPIEALRPSPKRRVFDVVGPVCESSDVLGTDIQLPADLKEGDIVIIHGCGAYGRSMSSEYNLRPLPPEIWGA